MVDLENKVWWLLECGHYGRSPKANTVAEASGTEFVYVECQVCDRAGPKAKRRRVRRV